MSVKQQKFINDKLTKIVKSFLDGLESKGVNWSLPYVQSGMPRKLHNGQNYEGVNVWVLWDAKRVNNFHSNVWGTWDKIINKLGGRIHEDQAKNFTYVVGWGNDTETDVYKRGSKKGQEYEKRIVYITFSKVYNLDQTNLDEKKLDLPNQVKNITDVDTYVANTKAVIRYGNGDADKDYALDNDLCYYSPSRDHIQMVAKEKFLPTEDSTATENYYATLLHEISHWSGHKFRLNRNFSHYWEDDHKTRYAFEELVAELSSTLLCCHLDITSVPRKSSAQYLNVWKQKVIDNPRLFIDVCQKANKVVKFLDKFQTHELIYPKQVWDGSKQQWIVEGDKKSEWVEITNKDLLADKTKKGFIKKVA
jgi:antirestriction protein ArdC